MKIIADYHTHTIYSDGKSTIEDNVVEAIKKGLKTIGISDHGPGHLGFGVKKKNYPIILDEIKRLREKYQNIEILLGIEANIMDDKGNIDLYDDIRDYFDYVMAGYHFGSTPQNIRGIRNHFNNFIKPLKSLEVDYNTRALTEALRQNDIFILTHPGDKGDVYIEEVAKAAIQTNTVLEINSSHHNLTEEQILKIKDISEDLKFSLGSDAHISNLVGDVEIAIKRAINTNLDPARIINIQEV